MNRRRFIVCAVFLGALLTLRAVIPIPLGFFKPASGISAAAQSALNDWVTRVQGRGSDVTIPGTQTAVGQYIDGLMTDGVWSKLKRHSIDAGDTLAALEAPLINTIGAATDTLNNFDAGDYAQDLGLKGNGVDEYISTGVGIDNAAFGDNDIHLSVFVGAPSFDASQTLGAQSGGGSAHLGITTGFNIASSFDCLNLTVGQGRAIVGDSVSYGHYIGSRTAANSSTLYLSGTSIVSIATSGGTRTSQTLYIHGLNDTGSLALPTTRLIEMYSIGTGLTPTDVANFTSRYATLRAALGRSDANSALGDWIARVKGQSSDVTIAGTTNAVKTFISGLMSDGVWNKIMRFNIYAGDDLNALKAPLKNTAGAAVDTLNNFDSGDYNQATGLTGNGTDEYISTGLASNAGPMGDNDLHLAYYARTTDSGTIVNIGTTTAAASTYAINISSTTYFACNNGTTGLISVADTNNVGHYVGSRIAANNIAIYKDGSSIVTGTGAAGSRSALINFVHAGNENGNPLYFTARTLEMYSIGLGLTAGDAANFSSRYATLRTALGR